MSHSFTSKYHFQMKNKTRNSADSCKYIVRSAKKLLSYERKYKFQRWPTGSDEYQEQLGIIEDGRKSGLLAELHSLLIEKQYYYAVRKEKAGMLNISEC